MRPGRATKWMRRSIPTLDPQQLIDNPPAGVDVSEIPAAVGGRPGSSGSFIWSGKVSSVDLDSLLEIAGVIATTNSCLTEAEWQGDVAPKWSIVRCGISNRLVLVSVGQ